MLEASARNLRTAERFLIAPPLAATFGSSTVSVCDISAKGARFRHDAPLEMGNKSVLKVPLEGRQSPFSLEAVVVWTQTDSSVSGRFVTGVRTYASADLVNSLLAQLHASNRSERMEELRSTDRFYIVPTLPATFGDAPALIEDLSARGARIDTAQEMAPQMATLRFNVPMTERAGRT